MDWLASVGGVEQVLIEMLMVVLGGFAAFNSILETFQFLSINLDIDGYKN